jgi:hypothetical protein
MILVRAAKIVLAGENLMKLIAELKTFLVIYDFPAINENLKKRSNALEEEVIQLLKIKEENFIIFRRRKSSRIF